MTGADLRESDWDAFFGFYMDTGERKWGQPYLNRRFFSLLGERMADRVVLFLAKRGGRTIAGALNLKGADCLFGRYWGCSEHHKFLHFETCYYQAIDFAIAHGLARVEAGAQGPHKLQRAYLPARHLIRRTGFATPASARRWRTTSSTSATRSISRSSGSNPTLPSASPKPRPRPSPATDSGPRARPRGEAARRPVRHRQLARI